jgi:hypothetical protein
VHRDPRCVDLAEKRRAFPRALRLPGPLDLSLVREAVQEGTAADSTAADSTAADSTAAPPRPPSREQVETA